MITAFVFKKTSEFYQKLAQFMPSTTSQPPDETYGALKKISEQQTFSYLRIS